MTNFADTAVWVVGFWIIAFENAGDLGFSTLGKVRWFDMFYPFVQVGGGETKTGDRDLVEIFDDAGDDLRCESV